MKKYQKIVAGTLGGVGLLGIGLIGYKKYDLATRLPLERHQIQPTLNDLIQSKNSTQILQWKTMNGEFRGWEDQLVNRLQGIRYAISERYGEPEAYTYPEGVHEMVTPAPMSVQNRSGFEEFYHGVNYETLTQDEFGQYLSITLPKDIQPNEKLPVLVWIHGGGYNNGGIDIKAYDPKYVVSQHRLIVVSISYRLGVLGYLRNRTGSFANLGLLDQLEALRWIKRNIEFFGGDSDRITIYGESAGANAVHHLMISEGAEDLFQRAIIASAPFGTMTGREKMNQELLDAFMEIPIDASLSEIMDKQAQIMANVTEEGNPKRMIFAPHYGVYPLPNETEIMSAWKKATKRVDVLVGATTREAAAFIGEDSYLKLAVSLPGINKFVEEKLKVFSHEIFIDGAKQFAEENANNEKSMYYYQMTWGEGLNVLGASHTIDLSLFFGNSHPKSPILLGYSLEEVEQYGGQFRAILADFVKSGKIKQLEIPNVIKIEDLSN